MMNKQLAYTQNKTISYILRFHVSAEDESQKASNMPCREDLHLLLCVLEATTYHSQYVVSKKRKKIINRKVDFNPLARLTFSVSNKLRESTTMENTWFLTREDSVKSDESLKEQVVFYCFSRFCTIKPPRRRKKGQGLPLKLVGSWIVWSCTLRKSQSHFRSLAVLMLVRLSTDVGGMPKQLPKTCHLYNPKMTCFLEAFFF